MPWYSKSEKVNYLKRIYIIINTNQFVNVSGAHKAHKEVSLLPILMISDKFKWKSDGGLIKPRQRKVEISFIFSPLYFVYSATFYWALAIGLEQIL